MIKFIERGIEPLFATPLFASIIEDTELLKELYQKVMNLKEKGHGNGNHMGWWSWDDIHCLPEFEELAQTFANEAGGVMDFLQVKKDSCYLTSMWANVGLRPEYVHMAHVHPNSLISVVFHLSMPDGCANTAFSDPRPGARVFEPTYHQMGEWNSGVRVPPLREGTLYMFPSYLPHGVNATFNPYPEDKNRITISFNAMMTGTIETRTAPLELK